MTLKAKKEIGDETEYNSDGNERTIERNNDDRNKSGDKVGSKVGAEVAEKRSELTSASINLRKKFAGLMRIVIRNGKLEKLLVGTIAKLKLEAVDETISERRRKTIEGGVDKKN